MALSVEATTDLSEFVALEDAVRQAEGTGLRARWEFGHALLAARDGKGRLPNGWLTEVAEATGASRQELGHRMRFAERFPTEGRLSNAVSTFGSWHSIVRDALALVPLTAIGDSDRPLPEGTYRTIVADPPWRYDNRGTRGAAENHYPTMTVEELCDLEVEDMAASSSHLYLWTTNGFLREAFDVMESWGFTYRTCLVWVKPQIGLGNYFRSATEHVLFGIRGGLKTQDRTLRNWFEARRGKHSAKPESFYDLVERASPGPYLDMFARRRRLGWETWGNEA